MYSVFGRGFLRSEQRRSEFDPTYFDVRIVVYKVAVVEEFLRVLTFSPVKVVVACSKLIYLSQKLHNLTVTLDL